MTQEQLNQIFDDICVHGRHVEGWSCDQDGTQPVLQDNKRGHTWERTTEGDWTEAKGRLR